MADRRPALGRGLSALIPDIRPATTAAADPARPQEMDIDLLTPNPQQPRAHLEEHSLDQLAQSIRAHGVIQPILVRRIADRVEIVAGERRWRAAQRAGLLKVPIVFRDVADDMQLSQEAIAGAVGKDRATVANYMRLLRLPVEVRNDLATAALSMGHAR